jgi:hypothetical protein
LSARSNSSLCCSSFLLISLCTTQFRSITHTSCELADTRDADGRVGVAHTFCKLLPKFFARGLDNVVNYKRNSKIVNQRGKIITCTRSLK